MPKLPFTYDPINVLKPVADDIWIVDGPRIRMSMGPLHVPFPTRMTVLRLPQGICQFHRDDFGTAGIFITQTGDGARGSEFEAVFT